MDTGKFDAAISAKTLEFRQVQGNAEQACQQFVEKTIAFLVDWLPGVAAGVVRSDPRHTIAIRDSLPAMKAEWASLVAELPGFAREALNRDSLWNHRCEEHLRRRVGDYRRAGDSHREFVWKHIVPILEPFGWILARHGFCRTEGGRSGWIVTRADATGEESWVLPRESLRWPK